MTDSRLHFFPVRHHSPAGARLVCELIDQIEPSAILIEGPADYNPNLDQLGLDHKLPIAIYSYVVRDDGTRQSAYYPFCEYSPEWRAIRHAFDRDIGVRFIDLPWADMAAADDTSRTNRYADGSLRDSPWVQALCERFGEEDFDCLWDRLFEIDKDLDVQTYLSRCRLLCDRLRDEASMPPENARREQHMARYIRTALDEFEGPLVVVTGAFHTQGLIELLHASDAPEIETREMALGDGRGLALTPYSYTALDALGGYNAGMPNPGFYHRVWQDRRKRRAEPSYRGVLSDVVKRLRKKKQLASAADLIAVETTARALAKLRAHQEVWRTDLVDGVIGALVKEELSDNSGHPLLDEVNLALRGSRRGRLAAGTALPALVLEVQRNLEEKDLTPTAAARSLTLDLADEQSLEVSRLLHGLRVFRIHGFTQTQGLGLLSDTPSLEERWKIQWHAEFEGGLIHAATYGGSLKEAAAARLLEALAQVERSASLAAELLLDATLAGIDHVSGALRSRMEQLIADDDEFVSVARALSHLLYLYRYEPVLGTVGRQDIGELLRQCFNRAVVVLESSGDLGPAGTQFLSGLGTLIEALERCEQPLQLDRDLVREVLERTVDADDRGPLMRGGCLGALWTLGDRDWNKLSDLLTFYAGADTLGDFLLGVFRTAREVAKREPRLMGAIDDVVMAYDDDAFLLALPGLRLAFTAFPPREKHHMALSLANDREIAATQSFTRLAAAPHELAHLLRVEGELFSLLDTHGVRAPNATGAYDSPELSDE